MIRRGAARYRQNHSANVLDQRVHTTQGTDSNSSTADISGRISDITTGKKDITLSGDLCKGATLRSGGGEQRVWVPNWIKK